METIDLLHAYNQKLFERAYAEILLPAFPEENERESQQSIAERLACKPPSPQPLTHAFLSGRDLSKPEQAELLALLILEVYRRSGLGLITYLATKPSHQKSGLGKNLMERARTCLKHYDENSCLMAEAHNPQMVQAREDILDPNKRLRIFGGLGATIVPIRYVQPSLSMRQKPSRNLLLLAFPLSSTSLTEGRLILFLEEFYQALGVEDPTKNLDFRQMLKDLQSLTREPTGPAGWQALANSCGCGLARIVRKTENGSIESGLNSHGAQ
ncbi:hypothetical protein [Synechococcus sp. GFB01]|uniref:hypothetical protein n=1 Tax=Synechococcus sp. GFB01 TaxID=1662190 RepID=UPI00128E5F95|nr:hypothetical protein [Synechococcus sp. GFB01]